MVDLKGTSWQQRYSASEIYTLRCRILDKPGMFAKVSTAIGQAGAHLHEIRLISVEGNYIIRDVTIFVAMRSWTKC